MSYQGVCTSFCSHLASMSREKHADLVLEQSAWGKSIKLYLFDRLSHFTVFFKTYQFAGIVLFLCLISHWKNGMNDS